MLNSSKICEVQEKYGNSHMADLIKKVCEEIGVRNHGDNVVLALIIAEAVERRLLMIAINAATGMELMK